MTRDQHRVNCLLAENAVLRRSGGAAPERLSGRQQLAAARPQPTGGLGEPRLVVFAGIIAAPVLAQASRRTRAIRSRCTCSGGRRGPHGLVFDCVSLLATTSVTCRVRGPRSLCLSSGRQTLLAASPSNDRVLLMQLAEFRASWGATGRKISKMTEMTITRGGQRAVES